MFKKKHLFLNHFWLGNAEMLKKPSDSLPYFENAIKLEPNVEMILNNYGIALRDAGKKKKANEIFKRAENLGRFNQVKRPGFDG